MILKYWYLEFLYSWKTTRTIENEKEEYYILSSNDNISFDRHSSWQSISLKDRLSSTSTLTFVLVRSSLMINYMWQYREWRKRRIFTSLFLINRLHRHVEYAMCNENRIRWNLLITRINMQIDWINTFFFRVIFNIFSNCLLISHYQCYFNAFKSQFSLRYVYYRASKINRMTIYVKLLSSSLWVEIEYFELLRAEDC